MNCIKDSEYLVYLSGDIWALTSEAIKISENKKPKKENRSRVFVFCLSPSEVELTPQRTTVSCECASHVVALYLDEQKHPREQYDLIRDLNYSIMLSKVASFIISTYFCHVTE